MDRDEKIMLAGELALGLLGGERKRAALTLVETDAEAREEFRLWQDSFCEAFFLSAEIAETTPPARVKSRIDARLFGTDKAQTLWDKLRAPENRPWVVTLLAVKAALILYLIVLFL